MVLLQARRHRRHPLQLMSTPTTAILVGMALCVSAADGAACSTPAWRSSTSGWSRRATTSMPIASRCCGELIIPLVKPGSRRRLDSGRSFPRIGAYVTPRVLGGGKNMMLGNLIELQFGQGRNWPLGSALSVTPSSTIVMVALLAYVRFAGQIGRGAVMADACSAPAGHFQCAGKPASPPSRSPASSCSTCRSSRSSIYAVQRRRCSIVRSGSGLLRGSWYQSAWQNDAGARRRVAVAGRSAAFAAVLATTAATMAALATTRTAALSAA